jgi:hypothetical protein
MQNKALARIFMVAGMVALYGCGQSSTPSTPGAADSAAGNPVASGSGQRAAEPAPVRAPAPKPIVVDAGTAIEVTVDQAVSSKTSNAGDHFDASLAAPVLVGEKLVIPSGAKVVGTVTDAKSAGKFKGNAEISVTLDSITVNGQSYPLKTTSITHASKGRGERTAIGTGGGAAAGALIGALAGGGKGAAIGAGAGAGAGLAGSALTGARDITIAPETKLSFKLEEALKIKRK